MKIRMGPVGFDLHPLMIAGLAAGAVGIALWAAVGFGALPEDGVAEVAGRGLTLGGMVLYFLGRVVQLWMRYRGKP